MGELVRVDESGPLSYLIEEIAYSASSGDLSPAVKEALDNVQRMLLRDSRGWQPFVGGGDNSIHEGFTLAQLKEWSKKLRQSVVAAPWIKRGFGLRSSYIWRDGLHYANLPKRRTGAGRPSNADKTANSALEAMSSPHNQRTFFSGQAHKRREGMLYHDGIAVWIGNDETKELDTIPLAEITEVYTDPRYTDVIWGYKREWSERNISTGEYEPKSAWYFVDTFKHLAPSAIADPLAPEKDPTPVETGYTAFDMHANRLEGWRYGNADALAAWIWNEIARDLYMDGVTVSRAMSTYAFKYSASNSEGSKKAGVAYAEANGAGSMIDVGKGADMVAMTTAGKAYDFSQVREVVSLIASALDVSNIHLTSNPGDAGSSYGSASSLDLPTRLAMTERREEHLELERRVLAWMGFDPDVEPYFLTLDDGAEIYRKTQALSLPNQAGIFEPEEYKERINAIWGIPSSLPIPNGIIIPSNVEFPESPTNDASADGGAAGSGAGVQAGSPDQGRSTKVGKANAPRDLK